MVGESPQPISGVVVANGGRPIVLKLLLTHESTLAQAAAAEELAAHLLNLAKPDAPLVPLEVRIPLHVYMV